MLDLVLLGLVPSTHFGKQLHRAELVGEFDLAALRVVGLRQAVIGGYFSDGRFQNLHQVLNCLSLAHPGGLRRALAPASPRAQASAASIPF